MDVVVDDLEIPNERLAWLQAAEDLKKPVYLRTELEVSRILTLISRLKYFQNLTFQERFALTKVATFKTAASGEILLTARGNPRLREVESSLSSRSPRSAGSPKMSPRGPQSSSQFSANSSVNLVSPSTRPDQFSVIVFGTVGLRIETINGRVQSVLGKGDPIGNPLMEEALQPGSQYVALEPIELLCFTMQQFDELLAQVDVAELKSRIQFFKTLVVPVLLPWGDAQYERLARSVYPLRLQSKELVVKEGNPSDGVYFILSGKLKVVREVDFSHGTLGGNGISSGGSGGGFGSAQFGATSGSAALGGTSSSALAAGSSTYVPLVKLLELATLNEGEFFGELAMIRYHVDDNRKTNLAKMLAANGGSLSALDLTNVSKKQHSSSSGPGAARKTTAGMPSPRGGVMPSTSLDEDSDADSDEEAKELSEDRPPLPRQATVYAHTPATVLVLPRLCFIDLFSGSALVRVREYAKGYPSQQEIKAHFSRQQKWETFKSELVAQVRGVKSSSAVSGGRGKK